MEDSKMHLGYSELTGRIYLGKQNVDYWVGEKRDVTSEFIAVMIQKFGPENKKAESNITIDGKPKYKITVEKMEVD